MRHLPGHGQGPNPSLRRRPRLLRLLHRRLGHHQVPPLQRPHGQRQASRAARAARRGASRPTEGGLLPRRLQVNHIFVPAWFRAWFMLFLDVGIKCCKRSWKRIRRNANSGCLAVRGRISAVGIASGRVDMMVSWSISKGAIRQTVACNSRPFPPWKSILGATSLTYK